MPRSQITPKTKPGPHSAIGCHDVFHACIMGVGIITTRTMFLRKLENGSRMIRAGITMLYLKGTRAMTFQPSGFYFEPKPWRPNSCTHRTKEIDWLMDSTQRHCLDGGPKMGRLCSAF